MLFGNALDAQFHLCSIGLLTRTRREKWTIQAKVSAIRFLVLNSVRSRAYPTHEARAASLTQRERKAYLQGF